MALVARDITNLWKKYKRQMLVKYVEREKQRYSKSSIDHFDEDAFKLVIQQEMLQFNGRSSLSIF